MKYISQDSWSLGQLSKLVQPERKEGVLTSTWQCLVEKWATYLCE